MTKMKTSNFQNSAPDTVPVKIVSLEELVGIASAPAVKDAEEALSLARSAEMRELRETITSCREQFELRAQSNIAQCARWLESLLEIRAALQAVRDRDGPVLGTIWMRDRPETVVAFIDHLRSIYRDATGAVRAPSPVAQQQGWISVDDRLPPQGELVLIYVPSDEHMKVQFDTWQEQYESPVEWSSATVPVGLMWDEHDFEEVTHWQPIPADPSTASPSNPKEKPNA